MNWFIYLLEANTYLLVFFGIYKIFLGGETFHVWNRTCLLISSSVSFILPLLKISSLRPETSNSGYAFPIEAETAASKWEWDSILLLVYLFIATLQLIKLLLQLNAIRSIIQTSPGEPYGAFSIVRIDNALKPFSFLDFIFLNENDRKNEKILRHEITHAQQRHSIDIIFLEVLHILNWFNPAFILIKREIRSVHEFLADEEAAKAVPETAEYALFLIQNSSVTKSQDIRNQMFNQSLLKKRILMLSKTKSPSVNRLRYGLMLALIPTMVCASSIAFSKSYGLDLAGKHLVQQDSVINKKSRKAGKKATVPPPPPAQPLKTKNKENVAPPPPPAQPARRKIQKEVPPPPPPVPPQDTKELSLEYLKKQDAPFKVELTSETKEIKVKSLEKYQMIDSPIKQVF